MAVPQIALNKLGELRNQDPTKFQIVQELKDKANSALADLHGAVTTLSLLGDARGALSKTIVAAIQGQAIATTAPTLGQTLTWNGSAWAPATPAATGVSALFSQTTDSTTSPNSDSSLLGTGTGSLTLPAAFFAIGKGVRLRVGGYVSVADGGTGMKTIKASLGGITVAQNASTANFASTLGTPWVAEIGFVCRTTGAPGTCQATGWFNMQTATVNSQIALANNLVTNITTTGTLVVNLTYNNGNATGTLTTTFASMESV